MNRTQRSRIFFFPILMLILFGCEDQQDPLPHYPLETLRAAPDTITVTSQFLTITTFLMRDLNAIYPGEKRPMYAHIILQDLDSIMISDSFELNYLWVINGAEIWDTYFTDEEFSSLPPYQIEQVARNGPEWEPGTTVDVVVEISGPGGGTYLIQAREQVISANL